MIKQNQLAKADRRTLNSYDMLYNAVSNKPLFNQQTWLNAANDGVLDNYADLLFKSDGINVTEFRNKYNLDYADSKMELTALYNEIEGNRENVDTERKRIKFDEQGNEIEETYLASDYEYTLQLIRERTDHNQIVRQREIAQEMRDDASIGEHIFSAGSGIVTSAISGVASGIDNIIALIGSTAESIVNQGDNGLDTFTSLLASDKYRIFSGLRQDLMDFEINYTTMRDIDGNYSNYGKYIGGVMTSVGEMLPAMVVGIGTGRIAGGLGASTKTVRTIGSAASQGSFYAGMAAGNVQDMYLKFEANDADVPSAALLSNAAIKAGLQLMVEKGLGKILGTTSLDNMVFGKAMQAGTGSSLTKAGIKTLFKDTLQEGLEEVFQDTSDFLVDRAYGVYIHEFNDVTEISWQSLIDAFVIGSIASFAGSARNIIRTKNVYAGDKKLNKIASWQYGLNMQSFAESLDEIEKATHHTDRSGTIGPQKFTLTDQDSAVIKTATTEAYAAYRMITSIYKEIGEERFKAANDVLSKITEKINTGIFNITDVNEYVETIKNQLSNIADNNIKKAVEDLGEKLKDDGVTKVSNVIENNAETSQAKEIAKVMNVDNVVVTDGNTFTEHGKTLFISKNNIDKSVGELLKLKATGDLIANINKNFADTHELRRLSDTFNQYYGREGTQSEIVTALFYDKDFFSSTLLDGNKDAYKFLSYFVELGQKLKDTVVLEKVQKNSLNKIIRNWVESLTEYCIIHPEADSSLFLYAISDSKKRKIISDRIKRERWGGYVYRAVIENPSLLTETDLQVLKNRVYRVFQKDAADKLWDNINSGRESIRQIAMNSLAYKYENLFNAEYDGNTYLTDTSIPNRRFNRFLKDKGLTIKTLLNKNNLTESELVFMLSEYGEVNDDSIMQLRKKQFSQTYPDSVFEYDKNGSVNVYLNSTMVGYGKLKENLRSLDPASENDLKSRNIQYDIKHKDKILYGILNESLSEINRNYVTVNDVINNPDLLKNSVKDEIREFMFDNHGVRLNYITEESVLLWLSDYFINKTKTQSIVSLDDGSFAIGNTVSMDKVFDNDFNLKENAKLENIFKNKYIPDGLKLKFIDNGTTAYFKGYDVKELDGREIVTIDNTIYIPKKFLKLPSYKQKFILAHELQHAIQFDKHMNHGFSYIWTSNVSDKLLNAIIKDVKKHLPHLFRNVSSKKMERDIVESFVYYGCGESMAYGLNRNNILDFYPVIIKNTKNGSEIVLPWGTTFKISDSEIKTTISGITKTIDNIASNKLFKNHFNLQARFNMQALNSKRELRNNEKEIRNQLYKNKIVDIYTNSSLYDRNSVDNIKKLLRNAFSADDGRLKNISNKMMYLDLGINETYETFLNYDIPFICVSHNDIESEFKIGIVGSTKEDLVNQVTKFIIDLGLNLNEIGLSYGTFKSNEIYGYLVSDNIKQVFMPVNTTVNDVNSIDSKSNVITESIYNDYHEVTNINFINETFARSEGQLKKNLIGEDDPRAKDFISAERNPHAKYKERYYVLNEDGTQKLRKDGTPVYHYVYDKSSDPTRGRYVGKRKYKGTNLEYFNKKYTPLQMSKEMQKFVLNAHGLDPILQERINGSRAGTLTEKDVMDYFRSANKIDDKTFKAINDAFFKNEFITTFKELQDRIDTKLAQSWAFTRLVRTNEKMKAYEKILTSTSTDVSLLVEAIENNKDTSIAKYYGRLYSNFDQLYGRSLDIKDEYARMTYMRRYNGTIASEWEIGANVRYVSIHNYNVTHKDSLPNEVVTEAYEELIEGLDMSKGAVIDAIKDRELARKAKELVDAGENYRDHVARLLRESEELVEQLESMSIAQIKKIYDSEGGIGKVVAEGVIAETTGELVSVPDSIPVITSAAIINNIRGFLNTIRKNLTPKERDEFVKEHADLFERDLRLRKEVYQNVFNNKTVKGVHYCNKTPEELYDLLDKVAEIKDEVLEKKRKTKESIKIKSKREKEYERKIKRLERENEELRRNKSSKSNNIEGTITRFDVENDVITLRTNIPIPDVLKDFLRREYKDKANTTVKNLSETDEKHVKMISKDFYEVNAEKLHSLTQGDVNDIVDFYTKPNVPLSEVTAPYIATEIWVLTYLIESGRNGSVNFVIDAKTLEILEKTLKNLQSTFGTGQVVWRDALKKLNPPTMIAQTLAKSIGIDINDNDIESLLKSVQTRDMSKVEAEKNRIYQKYLKDVMNKRANRSKLDKALDKILQYERLAMLSGPGTWVRNWTSNMIIEGTNKLSDGMSGKMEQLLFKLFPQSQKVKNQYKIAGTKVSNEVQTYIKNNLLDNGLLDSVMDALIKYDPRRDNRGKTSETVLTELLTSSIKSMYRSEHLSNNKHINAVEDFIRKMLSDNKHVQRAAIRYLGKMLTEDIESGRAKSKKELLWENGISKQFLEYVAEAFKLASHDYMHRSNALMALESKIAKKSTGAYFMYKQLFPFAGASWNWFVEGMNYTPIGLAKSIINFAKLENTIEKMDEARRTHGNNDFGISSDFAKYITIRNINKGIIGSVGFLIGALLAAFGFAKLDEEDDKYKLVIGDTVYLDVSNLFGTQGIFFGISIAGSIINKNSVIDVISAGLDQLFIDSTFADVFNNFRYSKSFGDWLTYQPVSMLNMMIPNFIKTITSVTTPYNVKYSDGIQGKAERLLVSAIPGLSYLFPHYYDPYTGEKQVPQKFWALTKIVNKLSPFGISIYNVSDLEKLCIEYGVNKGQLSGRYTVNDKSVRLSANQIEKLNRFYGQLNVTSFKEFENSGTKFKIKQKDGTYKNVTWSQLSDKEKAAIVSRTMTNNSGYAKIYILTDSGKYKYYATDSEYREFRALGITKNVYRSNNKNNGFVEIN